MGVAKASSVLLLVLIHGPVKRRFSHFEVLCTIMYTLGSAISLKQDEAIYCTISATPVTRETTPDAIDKTDEFDDFPPEDKEEDVSGNGELAY